MNLRISTLGLVALFSLAGGCVDRSDEGDDVLDEEDVGTAPAAQIEPQRSYAIKQGGVLVASAWKGTITGGVTAEYWVSRPAYSATAARSFDGIPQSCVNWKRSVCGDSWSGATYWQAVYTEVPLDCGLPPGPCTPIAGATSFLGAGSYGTSDAIGLPFADTYVSGGCEYWAMKHTIGSGNSTQSPLTPGFSSHGNFISQVCAMSPPPSTYFEVTFVDIGRTCSSIVC